MKISVGFSLLLAAMLAATFVLSGCDKLFQPIGGSSNTVAGYYTGQLASTSGGSRPLVALITADGHAKIAITNRRDDGLNPQLVVFDIPAIALFSGRFSEEYTLYSAASVTGGVQQTGTIEGTVDGDRTINAQFASRSQGDSGQLRLQFDQGQYHQPASLQTVQGTYKFNFLAANATVVAAQVQLDGSGKITGTDNLSCIYGGRLAVPDQGRNLYSGTFKRRCNTSTATTYDVLGTRFSSNGRLLLLGTAAGNQRAAQFLLIPNN